MQKWFFLFAVAQGCWALSCGLPTTIAPLTQNGTCYEPEVVTGINDNRVALVLWDVNGKEIRAAFRDGNDWSKPSTLSKTKKKYEDVENPLCKIDREGNIEAYWRFGGTKIDRIEGKTRQKGQSTWGELQVDCDVSAINKDVVDWEGGHYLDGESFPKEDAAGHFVYCPFDTRATDIEGNVCIAGQIIDKRSWPTDMALYAQIHFKDGRWSDPTIIGDFASHSKRPALSVDGFGNFLLLWRDDHLRALFACYKPVGQPWGEVIQLTPQNEVVAWSRIAADKKGRFVVIWEYYRDDNYSVHGLTFSADNCQWSDPVQLSPNGKRCSLVSFALSDQGSGIVAWTKRKSSSQSVLQVADIFLD